MELRVRSELAEASLHLVNVRRSEYERSLTSVARGAQKLGAPRAARARSLYAVATRSAGLETVLRVATVAEVFASEHLFQLGFASSTDDFAVRAWDRVVEGVQRWPERKSVWSSIFEVQLASFGRWDQLDALILARNVIAHGLGTLTRRQQTGGIPKEGVVQKLRKLTIDVDGLDLVIEKPQVDLCAGLVLEFIEWLDDLTQGQGLGARARLAS